MFQLTNKIKIKQNINIYQYQHISQYNNIKYGYYKYDIIIYKMRVILDIMGNHTLLGQQAKFPLLPSINPNSILKLSQNNTYIFLKYQPIQSQSPHNYNPNNNTVEVSHKLLQLNSMQNGLTQLEIVHNIVEIKKLKIWVKNKIDWQIINNKANTLQQQFMNQIGIVWHNAYLPLNYDKYNSIALRVQLQENCRNGVGYLVQNSQLQILVQNNDGNGNSKQVQKQQVYGMKQVRVMYACMIGQGNINKIYVSKYNNILTKSNKSIIENNNSSTDNVNNNINTEISNNNNNNTSITNQKTNSNPNIKIKFNTDNDSDNSKIQKLSCKQINEQISNKYQYHIQYNSINIHKQYSIPCDTDKLTVKQQINIINTKTNYNNIINNNNNNNKVCDIIIQIQCIEQQQLSKFNDYCKQQHNFNNNNNIKIDKSNIQQQHKFDQQNIMKQNNQKQQNINNIQNNKQNNKQNNIIYINQVLLNHWGIYINKQLKIIRKSKLQNDESKKLQYMLKSIKGLNIQLQICQKQDQSNKIQNIKDIFINNIINVLTNNNNNDNENNSVKIYSKIPYIVRNYPKYQTQGNIQQLSKLLSTFVVINNNNNVIADPLTIIHTLNNNKNNNKNNNNKQQYTDNKKLDKQIQNIRNKLHEITKINNYYYNDQSNNDINVKVRVLNKINYLLNLYSKSKIYAYINNSKINNSQISNSNIININSKISNISKITNINNQNNNNSKQDIFLQLYKLCFKQQINKIIQIINNTKLMTNKQIQKIKQNNLSQIPQQQKQQIINNDNNICVTQNSERLILISSFSNNGKTILNKILNLSQFPTLYIDISQLDDTSLILSDICKYLQITFQLCQHKIIFMDNIDSVCYTIDNGDIHRKQQKIASKLILRMILKYSKLYNKICIFTCKNYTNVDQQLNNYQLIKLINPNRQLRKQITKFYYYKFMCNNNNISNIYDSSICSSVCQNQNENQNQYNKNGYKNVQQKIQQIVNNSQSMPFGEFSKYVLTGHKEQSKKKQQVVNNFTKLAGVKQAKQAIRSVIQKPTKYSIIYKKLPIKLSRGILLYGSSGTGKTAIGESLADQFKMKYFSVKGSDILSKYIGGSEAAVRDIFEKAMSVSPSIVFFDEFESIVPRRNASNTGVTDRVVNQFLCYLDGVASVEGVYIMAASSRPQLIDPALLRPGRIDTHIFLDYPNNQQRQQLFQLYSSSIKFQTSLKQLIQLTQGYSYSDLIGLIKQLRIKKSAQIINKNADILQSNGHQKIDANQFKFISHQFFMTVFKNYKVSITKEQQKRQKQKYLSFKRGDAPDISKQKTILQ